MPGPRPQRAAAVRPERIQPRIRNRIFLLTLTRTPPLAPYTHLYALHALLDAGDRLSLHRIAAMLKGKRLADFFEIGPQGDAQSF